MQSFEVGVRGYQDLSILAASKIGCATEGKDKNPQSLDKCFIEVPFWHLPDVETAAQRSSGAT